ncbi:DUF3179 domain-containing protein [Candidatus Pacebacteria bacterium]|nr:DUF3179 domain-containing protein [Candidatus Paceibacterota bacterium]
MTKHILLGVLFIIIIFVTVSFFRSGDSGSAVNVRSVSNETNSEGKLPVTITGNTEVNTMSQRELFIADQITLPLAGSAPTENVTHSIPIDEIRQGCFQQDCIPSVDDPKFVSVTEANKLLPEDTIGVALSYKEVDRFYPFNMLVTREIVNDVVADDPLLVTYCPLCGTGIVFDRSVNGVVYEFGVSGMLWQSNLLMYNRAPEIEDRNLWSQVLGEAVVGESAGTKLRVVPSDIMKYVDWAIQNSEGIVLNTGRIGDPYGGDYYGVARRFAPDFDETSSPLDPSAYVYGIEVGDTFKAYPSEELPVGVTTDTIGTQVVTITKSDSGLVVFANEAGEQLVDIEGFWFSWIAAHPETELWSK